FKLGVDLAGGTILVYEIDLAKFPSGQLPEGYDAQKLATQLKKRIDPADLYNVTIRPVGQTRVEIILPTGGSHQARKERESWNKLLEEVKAELKLASDKEIDINPGQVQELAAYMTVHWPTRQAPAPAPPEDKDKAKDDKDKAKEKEKEAKAKDEGERIDKEIKAFLASHYEEGQQRRHLTSEQVTEIKDKIARQGSLEFRILSNERDDHDGIEAARKQIADPRNRAQLEANAMVGKAPPPPTPPDKVGFTCRVEPGHYTYSWTEVGKSFRKDLKLLNLYENDPSVEGFQWKRFADARAKGEALLTEQRGLFYSRKVPDSRPLAKSDK